SLRIIGKVPHKSFRSDYITEGRFCGSCHDVLLPDGTRLEEAFIEWKNGPYARRNIHCQDCHMSPVPGKPIPPTQWEQQPIVPAVLSPRAQKPARASHKFTGPDYALFPKFGQADLKMDDDDFNAWEASLEEDRKTLFRNAATIKVSHPDQIAPGSRLR